MSGDGGGSEPLPEPKRSRFGSAARGVVVLSFALSFGATAASCSSSVTPAKLTEGCAINSDCDSPLVCAFQVCHQQCTSARDCPKSELCVTAAGGSGGRLGVFYTQNGLLYGRQAGYASLPGADCVVGSDCASGTCKSVVASGPTARSACQ
jgi:hypothetical protein